MMRDQGSKVQGKCPLCRTDSLFLGSGGYVTCSISGCKDPGAATKLLKNSVEAVELQAAAERFVVLTKVGPAMLEETDTRRVQGGRRRDSESRP